MRQAATAIASVTASMARSITIPDATAAATRATDAACPTAFGTRARSASAVARLRAAHDGERQAGRGVQAVQGADAGDRQPWKRGCTWRD